MIKIKTLMKMIPFLIMGMVGCEENEQINTILPKTDLSEKTLSFFESALPITGESNFRSSKCDA